MSKETTLSRRRARRLTLASGILLAGLTLAAGGAQPPAGDLVSPYAQQPNVATTGLLPAEVDALSRGAGMALALPAEVNGYPGPRHVLEAADAGELELGSDQRRRVQLLSERMHAEALAKGREILDAERDLTLLFRHASIDETTLAKLVGEIAQLRGELRLIHLRPHLEIRSLLRAEQVERYRSVRGYDHGAGHSKHGH